MIGLGLGTVTLNTVGEVEVFSIPDITTNSLVPSVACLFVCFLNRTFLKKGRLFVC